MDFLKEVKGNSRYKEMTEKEKIAILAVINYIVYERKQDSYRGWWGGKVKEKLEEMMKEAIINGDGTDDIDIYNEVKN